jgi:hypothetical protein
MDCKNQIFEIIRHACSMGSYTHFTETAEVAGSGKISKVVYNLVRRKRHTISGTQPVSA